MRFMTSKPHPDIPEKREHFQPWVIPVDIPQMMELNLMRWVLIIGVMLISRYVFSAGLEVEPISHNFGDVLVNTTSAGQTFNLLNKEGNLLQIGKIESLTTVVDEFGNITTVPSTEFIISNDVCSNSQLGVIPSPEATCNFITTFRPQSLGTKTSVLLIPYSNGQITSELTIPLAGNSVDTLIPNIQVEPVSYDFEDIQVGSVSDYQTLKVSNTSGGSLQIGKIKFSGDKDFIILYDFCSNQKVSQSQHCSIITRFEPKKVGTKTATLSIPSNDPDTPTVTVTLNGNGILGCSKKFSFSPNPVDFGTEVIGNQPMNLNLRINARTKGCDVKIEETFTITGTNAAEFSIRKEKCSHQPHNNAFYSHCSLVLSFSPISGGIKQAELLVTFNDATKETIPLLANAVKACQASLEISPNTYDFGTVTVGLDRQQELTLSNPSSCNVKIKSIEISGQDKSDFEVGKCRNKTLRPLQTCLVNTLFRPQSAGEKQANLNVTSSNVPVVMASLIGKGFNPTDCSRENITIESTTSGTWAEKGNGQEYDQPSLVWKRLQSFRTGENDTPNRPREDDVVLIKAGHNIVAIPHQIPVFALCVEKGGILESWSNQGTNLELRTSRYVENKGLIQGKNGVNEADNVAALPGANIVLSVGTILRNEGSILSGHGGSGKQFGAAGGNINIWANDIINTNDIGIIDAGRGGDITGIQSGQAGRGGSISLRGGNSLTSDGRRILAGNGGNCNPMAVQPQNGGNGGDMLFNANRVNLLAGTFAAGEGGKNCGPLGTDGSNGRSGRFNMDPGAVTLSGINTQIKGGDITLFGGKDWVLDLSNLGESAITATGNITLAVGEGGAIDMRGSANKFLKAAGKVIIFADDIILDENKTLDDLIEANDIIIGPSQILYDVSLTAPNTVSGEPNSILPIRLMLSNDGPEKDIYWLNLTDTAGWPLSQLPLTVEVEGLETIELVLNVTLPSTQGAKNTITITAISQSDPTVIATKEIPISVSATGNNSSTGVTPPPQPLSTCTSPNGIIDWICRNNRDQVLTNVTIETKGNVAGGILAGEVTNKGIISQVKVQSGAVVNGGKLTGYINNEGTLANFEFVGAEINGGTLAGTVNNNSKVGGTFKDVHLAADTHLRGGYLQGDIIGDMNAPALLEYVTIKSDSLLTGVKLGEGVRLEAKVTCGDGVQAQEGVCPSEIELPPLRATATNAQGESMMTAAIISGGISVNQGAFESQATLTIADLVDILGQIQVDPLDIGQTAEVVVYVSYKPLVAPFSEPAVYFMLNEKGDILPWDEDIKNLVAFQAVTQLVPYLEVPMYQGPLPATGHLKISFGYRLTDEGIIVHNLEPIEVTITE
ncbi:MAG: choice-of-anchor D domain-containing protein [Thioploca sp.]|nr:choice-of-anchor D domain-containing protein [Thioploca sp.]